ncbi:MAG: NAD-dependent epimerase/dehydratase family protein [Candidatus Micrarchaeota archaeon]|nr:NAD-dependent epimerase/dehydratase family protein [Candidatus Micrarchaeota archaeon]
MSKILVTGSTGQIGTVLVAALRQKYGKDNVVALDLRAPDEAAKKSGPWIAQDASDRAAMEKIIREGTFDTVYHLVGLLSAASEKNPELAWKINLETLRMMLDFARDYKFKLFWPSSIAAFGPTTPQRGVPQHTVLEPTTVYGVAKVAGELLCQYYFKRWGVDVRSVRYPGLVSWAAPPAEGTTEYTIHMLYAAVENKPYSCFLKEGTVLPMMSMEDAVRGTMQLMEAPAQKITVRTSYNFAAMSFGPEEIAKAIQKTVPALRVKYEPDFHQAIADSWPQSIDDSQARADWGWAPEYDLQKMCDIAVVELRKRLKA